MTATAGAEGVRSETYFVDNEVFQTYNGYVGKWVTAHSEAGLHFEIKAASTTLEATLAANKAENTAALLASLRDYFVFVPYGAEHRAKLEQEHGKRQAYEVPEGQYIWPVQITTMFLSSRHGKRWGGFHSGIDIACGSGTPVVAARAGRVRAADWKGHYGKAVDIEHKGGSESLYAHLSRLLVKKGDYVQKGQIIGLVGTTGRSTGPHLHFEINHASVALNPEDFLPPMLQETATAASSTSTDIEPNDTNSAGRIRNDERRNKLGFDMPDGTLPPTGGQ